MYTQVIKEAKRRVTWGFRQKKKLGTYCAQETSLDIETQHPNMKIKRDILKYLETNEDKNTTYQSLTDRTNKY